MDTMKMLTLKPKDMPKLLSRLMRYTLYVVSLAILGLGIVEALEAQMPRGTLYWLRLNGLNLRYLVAFTLLCGTLGVLLTHRVRKSFVGTMILYFVTTLPYLIYTAAESAYIATIVEGSRITTWMYLFGYVFAFLLVLFVALLSAWSEVTTLFQGGG